MGPNTDDEEMMRKLAKAGMDIARFNFSHGDHEEQKTRISLTVSCPLVEDNEPAPEQLHCLRQLMH